MKPKYVTLTVCVVSLLMAAPAMGATFESLQLFTDNRSASVGHPGYSLRAYMNVGNISGDGNGYYTWGGRNYSMSWFNWGSVGGLEAWVSDDVGRDPESFEDEEFTFVFEDNTGSISATATPSGIRKVPLSYDIKVLESGGKPVISWKNDDPDLDYYRIRIVDSSRELIKQSDLLDYGEYGPEAQFDFDGFYSFAPGRDYGIRIEAIEIKPLAFTGSPVNASSLMNRSSVSIPYPDLPITGSVINVHREDGSRETEVIVMIDRSYPGPLPGDIESISVTGPDGTLLYDLADFEYYGAHRLFFLEEAGSPALGPYTFEVEVKNSLLEGIDRDYQAENVVLPIPEAEGMSPSEGEVVTSKTPRFTWTPVEGDDVFYQLIVRDANGERLYTTNRVKGMTSFTLPQGVLAPGGSYQWQVFALDNCDWPKVQNRSESALHSFTMASNLSHDTKPAVDLNNIWGAVTWHTEDYGTALVCSVKVVDMDGVSSQGDRPSHQVTVTYPDGVTTRSLQYDVSDGPNAGWYSVYVNDGGTPPPAGEYVFTVTDPDGNTGTGSDTLVVDPLPAPDETTITPSLLNPSQEYITATFDNVYVNGALYDDFDGYGDISELDTGKWEPVWSNDVSLEDGKVKIESSPSVGRYSNFLMLKDPGSVESLQADIGVTEAASDDIPKARLGGYFYNDGVDDVFASIRVKRDKVVYRVGPDRVACGQVSWDSPPLAHGELMSVSPGQTVTASISWDGSKLTFQAGDHTASYTPEGMVMPVLSPMKRIGLRMDLKLDGTSHTFSWNPVEGANQYSFRVYDTFNQSTLWRGYPGNDPVYRIPPGVLEPNSMYRYRVEARDAHNPLDVDNVSKTPSSNDDNFVFYTGDESEDPYVELLYSAATTWNDAVYGERLDFWVRVYDAQGVPENIRSASVELPSGKVVPLYYDDENGYNTSTCGIYLNNSFEPTESGTYTFRVEDREGHVHTASEEMTSDPIGYPSEGSIQATLDGTAVDFDWEDVDGVAFYRVEIYNEDYERIYTLNTRESHYELGPGFLKEGELYRYRITSRREFWDQNADNGSSAPGEFFSMPTFVPGRKTGGKAVPDIETRNLGSYVIHTVKPGSGEDTYMLFLECHVEDEDGVPANIQSVVAEDPNGVERTMFFTDRTARSGATYYGLEYFSDPRDIPEGTYTFKVTDMDGNQAQAADSLSVDPIPVAGNLSPVDGATVSGTQPVIDWDDVPGAARYRVHIFNGANTRIYSTESLSESRYEVPEGVLEPGRTYSYRVNASREAYPEEDMGNISINSMYRLVLPHFTTFGAGGETTIEWGDVNGNGSVGFEDAVLALQASAGLSVQDVNLDADVNGDDRIGLSEALYVLNNANYTSSCSGSWTRTSEGDPAGSGEFSLGYRFVNGDMSGRITFNDLGGPGSHREFVVISEDGIHFAPDPGVYGDNPPDLSLAISGQGVSGTFVYMLMTAFAHYDTEEGEETGTAFLQEVRFTGTCN